MTRKPALVVLSVLSFSIAFAFSPARGAPLPQTRAVALVKPAVVMIKNTYKASVVYEGKKYGPLEIGGSGSGFFVNPDGFVITNGHVVQMENIGRGMLQYVVRKIIKEKEAKRGKPFTKSEKKKFAQTVLRRATLVDERGKPITDMDKVPHQLAVRVYAGIPGVRELYRDYPAEVRFVSPYEQKDLAVLKIERKNVPTLKLGDSDKVQLLEPVFIIGYPGLVTGLYEAGAFSADTYLEATVKEGTVSARRKWKDGSLIIEHSATGKPGNSGGPALSARWEVIGVHSMGAPESGSGGAHASGYGFLRPVNIIKEFLRGIGVEAKQGLTDSVYAKAMTAYWAGQDLQAEGKLQDAYKAYVEAQVKLKRTMDLYTEHPDASGYLANVGEVLTLLEPKVKGPNWRLIAMYGGGAVVLALVIGGAVAYSRRPSAPAAPMKAPGAVSKGYLVAQTGPHAGAKLSIPEGGARIGRDSQLCQVVVQDETASREHALVKPRGGGYVLIGLSKTNPTYLNDKPVTENSLKDNDMIRVGNSYFVFRMGSS